MLLVTEHAAEVIETLIKRPDTPADAGLRIAGGNDGQEGITVAVGSPRAGDQLVGTDEAPVFVDNGATGFLDTMVLDVEIDDDEGCVQFTLAPQ